MLDHDCQAQWRIGPATALHESTVGSKPKAKQSCSGISVRFWQLTHSDTHICRPGCVEWGLGMCLAMWLLHAPHTWISLLIEVGLGHPMRWITNKLILTWLPRYGMFFKSSIFLGCYFPLFAFFFRGWNKLMIFTFIPLGKNDLRYQWFELWM